MPPRESSAAEYHYHKILARVIDEVLRRPSGRVRVTELATKAGFSRFHLARLFHHTADETLEQFLRRIRLERAAYMLLNTNEKVFHVAKESGYLSAEAFSRAFRQAFGCQPSEARKRIKTWELEATSDLHWNADWVLNQPHLDLDEHIVEMPTRYAFVWRVVGDYADLPDAWQRLQATLGSAIPSGGKFITIYRDNLWTHPVCRTLRADIGWICEQGEKEPAGMRKIAILAGRYAVTRFVEREDRTAAWSQMLGRCKSSASATSDRVSYDEYSNWPLPFDEVKTRLHLGVAPPRHG